MIQLRPADVAWYVNRFRAMSAAEVGHRVIEKGRKSAAGRRRWSWDDFAAPGGPLPALPVDRAALDGVDAATRAGWRALRDDMAAGRLSLLGQDWPVVDGRLPWHRDPLTGTDWPDDLYCFDVPYRRRSERGDVKYVWELNRLQVLPALAALARVERDAALEASCFTLIEDWIDRNPPFRGVNWCSGIELALRSVSLLLTLGILGPERVSPALDIKLRRCFAAHAFWLDRYPSQHSSANNHLVAEAAGLFLLGTLCPGGPDSARHAAYGRRVLSREALKQIHPDGVGAEQSPTYTALTCEWLTLAATVAASVGAPFAPAVINRLAAAGLALHWLVDARGGVPRIGDDDDSFVITATGGHDTAYVSTVVSAIGAATGRPALAPPAGRTGGLRGAVLGTAAGPAIEPIGTRVFPDGGLTVHRGPLAGRDALLAFDHGPLGYLSIAAHGHADALAIWLHLDGEPVLVDAGTFLYHAAAGARDRYRGTPAHNTLVLGDADQSLPAGDFNWREPANSRLLAEAVEAHGHARVEAEHDGYLRRFGILCRRGISLDGTGFTVTDRLVTPGGDMPAGARPGVSLPFLLQPGLRTSKEAGALLVERDNHPLLRVTPVTAMTARTEPARLSPRFGVEQDTTRLVFVPDDPGATTFALRFEVLP